MAIQASDFLGELLGLIRQINEDGTIDANANIGLLLLNRQQIEEAAKNGDVATALGMIESISASSLEAGRNKGVVETVQQLIDLAADWTKRLQDESEE